MNKVERKIIQSNEDWSFFQIWVIADLEFDGKIYRNEKQYNNDSILTPENWEQHKETFFTQRMAIYKDSYTLAEKIKLEVSGLEKLRINKTDYEVLKERYKSHLEQKQALPTQQIETKTNRLKVELGKYGFFELPMVKQLSEPSKQDLVELISTNDLPYIIAMVEYLGFLKHLKAEHFSTDNKLFKAVAKCLEGAERAVRGNIYVLSEISRENRTRYTAHQQKQKVQKDYEALK
jgi:hypothetical protein